MGMADKIQVKNVILELIVNKREKTKKTVRFFYPIVAKVEDAADPRRQR